MALDLYDIIPALAALVAIILVIVAMVLRSRGSNSQMETAKAAEIPPDTMQARDLVPAPILTTLKPLDSYDAIRQDIVALIDDPSYRDNTWGPLFVRLAWHSSGTYDPAAPIKGGSCPGTIRFPEETKRQSNKGLDLAIARLELIKAKNPSLSYADLFTLAGVVALKHMGGPDVVWNPGRSDKDESSIPPDGRLPDELKGADHVRQVFGRQKFNIQETVALIGCHSIGSMHKDRSVVSGQWTQEPTRFDNGFFKNLVNLTWKPAGTPDKRHFVSDEGFIMLATDVSLLKDPEMKKWVDIYAKDVNRFKKDFAAAFAKLISNGC